MFEHVGIPELLLILVVIFIFFGAGKLPQVGAQFGQALRSFKKAQAEDGEDESKPVVKTNAKPAKSMDKIA